MAGNLIENGNFARKTLSPWFAQGVFITEEAGGQERYAAVLSSELENVYLLQTVPIQPHEQYELQLSLATSGTKKSAPVSISVSYNRGDELFLAYGLLTHIDAGRIPAAGRGGWLSIKEKMAPPPAEATKAIVVINKLPLAGSGDIFLERVSLQSLNMLATPGTFAYVATSFSDQVWAIDVSSLQIVEKIDVGSDPMGVYFSADGGQVFVTNYSGNSVSIIDVATGRQVNVIPVGQGPGEMAIHPNGRLAYVSNSLSSTISIIDLLQRAVIDTLDVHADGLAISPDGSRLYASQRSSNALVSIETSTLNTSTPIPCNKSPHALAITPDGKRLLVTNSGANHTVTVLDTASYSIDAVIKVGNTPTGIVISPDGKKAYVAVSGDAALAAIDLAANTLETTVVLESTPEKLALSPDGKQLFITEMISDQVSVIDTKTLQIVQTIALECGPDGIAVGLRAIE